jgi:hypothetical protein
MDLAAPPLPQGTDPQDELKRTISHFAGTIAAQQGFQSSDLARLWEKGHFEVWFSTDREGTRIEKFLVFWKNSAGFGSQLVAQYPPPAPSTDKDKKKVAAPELSEEAKKVLQTIQMMLREQGLLGSKDYIPGQFDKKTVLALSSYENTKDELQVPDFKETKEELEARLQALEKKRKQLLALMENDKIDRRMIYGEGERLLRQSFELYSYAQNILLMLPEGWEQKPENDPYRILGSLCKRVLGKTNTINNTLIQYILGKTGETSAGEKLIYLDIKKGQALNERLNKLGKKTASAEKDQEEIELLDTLVDLYIQLAAKLQRYSEDFAGIPGVKERCLELLAKEIKPKLKGLGINLPEDPRHLSASLNSLFQFNAELKEQAKGNDEKEKNKLEKANLLYRRANDISKVVGAHPARSLLFSLIYQYFGEKQKVSLDEVFEKFTKIIEKKLDEKDLLALGKYMYARQKLAEEGKDTKDIDRETASLKGPAQKAINAIEKICGKHNDKLINQINRLVSVIYRLLLSHNTLVDSKLDKNARPITFNDVVELTNKVLAKMKELGVGKNKDAREIFEILAGLPEDLAQAQKELGRKFSEKTTQIMAAERWGDFFADKARKITISPRYIRTLNQDYARQSTLPLLYSRDELKRFFPELVPANAGAGDYFLLSRNGRVQKADPRLVEKYKDKKAPTESAGGYRYEREYLQFLEYEKAALIKLFLASLKLPISDNLRLSRHQEITTRITSVDVESMLEAFARGKLGFAPGTFSTGTEISSILKNILQAQQNGLSDFDNKLLARLLKGTDLRFESKETLYNLAKNLRSLTLASLDPRDRASLAQWIDKKFMPAIDRMERKDGLSETEINDLKKFALYLKEYGIVVHDARFVENDPQPDKVEFGRQLPEALKDQFQQAYSRAVAVLRKIHYQTMLLAGKYVPEEPKASGVGGTYWGYLCKAYESAKSSIHAPSVQSQTVVGLPNDQIFELNLFLFPQWAKELLAAKISYDGAEAKLRSAIDNLGHRRYLDLLVFLKGGKLNVPYKDEEGKIIDQVDKGYVDRLNEKIETLEAELKKLRKTIEDAKPGDNDDGEIWSARRKARVDRLQEFGRALDILRSVHAEVKNIADLSENLDRDPIQLMAYLKNLHDAFQSLKLKAKFGLFMLPAIKDSGTAEKFKGVNEELEKIRKLVIGEGGNGMLPVIEKLMGNRNQLLALVEDRDQKRLDLESIFGKIGRDNFTKEKWEALKTRLEAHFGKDWKQKLAGWFDKILLGERDFIPGIDGRDLRVTPYAAVERYFSQPGAELSLTSLLVEDGESMEKTIAKIGLSKIFEKLPREVIVKGSRTIPALVAGHGGNLAVVGVAFLGATLGEEGWDFGPKDLEEMVDILNNPWKQTRYNLAAFLARSSDTNPPVNLSSQFKMYLANRQEKGQKYLEAHINKAQEAKRVGSKYIFNEIEAGDVTEFIEDLNETIIPLIRNNAELRNYVKDYLIKNGFVVSPLIKQVVDEAKNPNPPDYTKGLFKGASRSFKLYNWQNSTPDLAALAQVFQDVLQISSVINQSRAVKDIKNTAASYYSPLDTVKDQRIPFKDQPEYTKTVKILRTAPDQTSVTSFGSTVMLDSRESLRIYSRNLAEDLQTIDTTDLVLHNLAGVGEGLAESYIKFMMAIPKQIKAGFTELSDQLAKMLDGLEVAQKTGDWTKFNDAKNKFKDSLAGTTGNFLVIESLSILMAEEGLNDLKKGGMHIGIGLAKIFFVLKMILDSLRVTWSLLKFAVKYGAVKIERGRMYINESSLRRALAERSLEPIRQVRAELPMPEFNLPAGIGVKLAWYSTPFGWYFGAKKGVKAAGDHYRYGSQTLDISITPDFEIIGSGAEPGGASGRARGVGAAVHRAANWQGSHLHPLRELGHLRDRLFASARVVTRRGVESFMPSAGGMADFDALDLLQRAKANPGRSFILVISPRSARRGEHGEKIRMRLKGRDLQALANSKSEAETGAIIEAAQKRGRVFLHSHGTAGDIHDCAGTLRYAQQEYRAQIEAVQPVAANEIGRDPVELVDKWAKGEGLEEPLTLRLQNGSEIRLNGSKIAKLMATNSGTSLWNSFTRWVRLRGEGFERFGRHLDQNFGLTLRGENGAEIEVRGRDVVRMIVETPFTKLRQLEMAHEKVSAAPDFRGKSARLAKLQEKINKLRAKIDGIGIDRAAGEMIEGLPQMLQERFAGEYGSSPENAQKFRKKIVHASKYKINHPSPAAQPTRVDPAAARAPQPEAPGPAAEETPVAVTVPISLPDQVRDILQRVTTRGQAADAAGRIYDLYAGRGEVLTVPEVNRMMRNFGGTTPHLSEVENALNGIIRTAADFNGELARAGVTSARLNGVGNMSALTKYRLVEFARAHNLQELNISPRITQAELLEFFDMVAANDPAQPGVRELREILGTYRKITIRKTGNGVLEVAEADLGQRGFKALRRGVLSKVSITLPSVQAQTTFLVNVRQLGQTLGVRGIENMSQEQIAQLLDNAAREVNAALRRAGKAQFLNNPAELIRFLETDRAGQRFVASNPRLRAALLELKQSRAGSILRHRLTTEIGLGLGVFLACEGEYQALAKIFPGLKTEKARFVFTLSAMMIQTPILGSLSLTKLQKTFHALNLAINNMNKFRGFLAEQYGTRSLYGTAGKLSRSMARSLWGGIRGIASPAMGGFNLVSKGYQLMGIENIYINMPLSIVTTAVGKEIILRTLGRAALEKLAPLGALGACLFVGDILDFTVMHTFYNEYERNFQQRLRGDKNWRPTTASIYSATRDLLRRKDLEKVTADWLQVGISLRGQIFQQTSAAPSTITRNYYAQVSPNQFAPTNFTLSQETREGLELIMQIPTDEFKDSDGARAIRDIKRFFNKDGSVKDPAGLQNYLINEFPAYAGSCRHPAAGLLNPRPEEQERAVLGLRNTRRLVEVVKLQQAGQPVVPTEADISGGLLTRDGKINPQSPYYQQMLQGEYILLFNTLSTAVAADKWNDARASQFMLALQHIKVAVLKLNYLNGANKGEAEAMLKAMGIAIEPRKWDREQLTMVLLTFSSAAHSENPNTIIAMLSHGEEVEGLSDFYAAINPLLSAPERELFEKIETIPGVINLAQHYLNRDLSAQPLSQEERKEVRRLVEIIVAGKGKYSSELKKTAISLVAKYGLADIPLGLKHGLSELLPRVFDLIDMDKTTKDNDLWNNELFNDILEASYLIISRELSINHGSSPTLSAMLAYLEGKSRTAPGVRLRVNLLGAIFPRLKAGEVPASLRAEAQRFDAYYLSTYLPKPEPISDHALARLPRFEPSIAK